MTGIACISIIAMIVRPSLFFSTGCSCVCLSAGRGRAGADARRDAALFVNYLPTPLVLLTDDAGHQSVNIAPEAFTVASAEFTDEVKTWQDALPGALKGQLSSVSLLRPF